MSSQVTCDGTGDEKLAQSQPCYPCDEIYTFSRICNSLNLLTQDELQKLSKLAEAVAKVKAAKTWADVQRAIGDDAQLQEQVETALTKEENARVGKLKMTAVKTVGTRVRYVGNNPTLSEQYGSVDLVVDEVKRDYGIEIACKKPDGSFTTWLRPQELMPV
ncbi:MAG: hypothetical protein JGK21_27850 [Microcoleus sp. PH2017_22_RUC_O_B]|uniref:hypothetical protein n=1 Tax=unclassified Microcoleus TaxID=2642155 RepID=UPI001D6668C1|nr:MULTISPECIES: hypothetical protein [unclassified Microcoleus]MCC3531771.1 hypothetical protein [Microcoleus sp. PH2017_21_RUC_O_A]MCC3544099.1 hypothetical protein [Microcoleus sp. PH2017_22_RUC_O_B]